MIKFSFQRSAKLTVVSSIILSEGALLDIELQRFFYALGIPMYQGYGLSEASPVISSNSTARHKLGSSGVLVNNMDLKICNDDGVEFPSVRRVKL